MSCQTTFPTLADHGSAVMDLHSIELLRYIEPSLVYWVYWEKDAEDGVARKEETGKAKKDIYGCGERGHC